MKSINTLKVLHVNTLDIQGGAARAAYRLHQSLLKCGIDSRVLVQTKTSDDRSVIGPSSKFYKLMGKLKPALDSMFVRGYKNKTKTLFSPSLIPSKNVVTQINDLNPDIVHLHWINNGMLRIEDICKIKAPIIWTLHDMWAFTGGCHYDEDCGGYIKKCGNCPVLNSQKKNDLSHKIFKRKKKSYEKISNISIVGVSRWLANCASKSDLFKNRNVITLPNALDASIFKPFNKLSSRDLWALPQEKKLVLYGAMGATSDPRKGFKELIESLRKINSQNVEFVVFGATEPPSPPELGCKVHYLGSLTDDVSLVTLYSAVDVMVVPSLEEAFGQTASEAMACATPVVAFGATGLLDIIDHKKNGYLAIPFDTTDLANGIDWVLGNDKYEDLCSSAREKVLQEFDSKVVAEKYIQLYKEIIDE